MNIKMNGMPFWHQNSMPHHPFLISFQSYLTQLEILD